MKVVDWKSRQSFQSILIYVPYLPFLVWANYKPDQVLESEEDDDEVVDEVDDKDDAGEVHSPLLVLLELLRRGDDEGDRGDHHLTRGLT